jgi:phosphoribosylformylglycinamidine (FGAM) synthase PurS component
VEQLVDDVGMDAFSSWVWEDSVDKDKWNEWLIEFYEETVYEDPEGYSVEKELSANQFQQVSQMELTIKGLNKKLQDVNLSDQDRETIETKIDGLDQTIEEIKDEPEGDYDEDSIRNIAESMASEYDNDITGFIDHYGFDKKFIMDFVDLGEVTETVVNSDGYGPLLSSSGEDAFEANINNKWYYIIPLD